VEVNEKKSKISFNETEIYFCVDIFILKLCENKRLKMCGERGYFGD